jgi:hypothetical protein
VVRFYKSFYYYLYYYLLLGCFCSELLIHILSMSHHVFPLLWYYCMLIWITRERVPMLCSGLTALCWAPLFGVSFSVQFLYIAFIALTAQILSAVFAPTPMAIALFALFSLIIFKFCVHAMSWLYFFVNLGVIAFLFLVIFYLLRVHGLAGPGKSSEIVC